MPPPPLPPPPPPLLPPQGHDYSPTRTQAVRLAIARRVFWRLWGAELPPDAEQPLLDYFDWGWTCIYGERFHTLTVNIALRRLDEIRAKVLLAVHATPAGRDFHTAISSAERNTTLADKLLVAAADGMLFSGMLAISHQVEGLLERIEAAPETMLPLWKADPRAFLVEHMRLNPPLTSVTAVTKERSTQDLGMGLLGNHSIEFEAGTTMQLLLAVANTDPRVFGGALHLASRARDFDPKRGVAELNSVLFSWTGLLPDVQTRMLSGSDGATDVIAIATDLVRPIVDQYLSIIQRDPGIADAATTATYDLQFRIYAEAFERNSLLDDCGFLLWGLTCLWAMWRLSLPPSSQPPEALVHRLGPSEAAKTWRVHPSLVGLHYYTYLIGQTGLCVAHFVDDPFLYQFTQGFAAAGYAALALRVHEYLGQLRAFELQEQQGTSVSVTAAAIKQKKPAAVDASPRPPTPKNSVDWKNLSRSQQQLISRGNFVYEYAHVQPGYLLMVMIWLFALGVAWLGHTHAPQASKQGLLVGALYGASCVAAYACLWAFYLRWTPADGDELRRIRLWGVIGGSFGIFNLFWPLLFPSNLYHILSRTADAFLYVPLVLRAVQAMDEELWSVVPWTDQQQGRPVRTFFFGASLFISFSIGPSPSKFLCLPPACCTDIPRAW